MASPVNRVALSAAARSRQHSTMTSVAITAFGVRVGLRVDDPNILPALLDRVPPGSEHTAATPERIYSFHSVEKSAYSPGANKKRRAKSTGKSGRRYEVRVGRSILAWEASFAKALDAFESDLQIHVAEMCENRIFVHAGVVGWRGKAILVPGVSGSGKTTLIASLLSFGATYYSDEYAVLDDVGHVHPYSRPLNVKLRRGRLPRQAQFFAGPRGMDPLPVGLIVVTQYQEGGHWKARNLSPGRAALALINNTVSIRRQPEPALSIVCRAASGVRALESVRGEASKVAQVLLSELDSRK